MVQDHNNFLGCIMLLFVPSSTNNQLPLLAALFMIMAMLFYVIRFRVKHKYKERARTYTSDRQKVMAQQLWDKEYQQHAAIAQRIHDKVGPALAVAKMNLSSSEENELLKRSIELIDQALAELRNISAQLVPVGLNFGIFRAVEELCQQLAVQNGVKITVVMPSEEQLKVLEKNNDIYFYRLIEKILDFRISHAAASVLLMDLFSDSGHLRMTINDDGMGFNEILASGKEKDEWQKVAVLADWMNGKIQVQTVERNTQITLSLRQHERNN